MKITEPTLHLASLELHGIVVLCKLSIVWTLIGTICIQVNASSFLIFADAAAKQINRYLLMESYLFVFSFYYPVCDVPCRAVKVDAYLGNWLLA